MNQGVAGRREKLLSLHERAVAGPRFTGLEADFSLSVEKAQPLGKAALS